MKIIRRKKRKVKMLQEENVFDMAYKGKFTAVKNLLDQDDKLKTKTDSVRN